MVEKIILKNYKESKDSDKIGKIIEELFTESIPVLGRQKNFREKPRHRQLAPILNHVSSTGINVFEKN